MREDNKLFLFLASFFTNANWGGAELLHGTLPPFLQRLAFVATTATTFRKLLPEKELSIRAWDGASWQQSDGNPSLRQGVWPHLF